GQLGHVGEGKPTALAGGPEQLTQAAGAADVGVKAVLVAQARPPTVLVSPARRLQAAATWAASAAFSSRSRVFTSTVRPPEMRASSATRNGVASRPRTPRAFSSSSARSRSAANSSGAKPDDTGLLRTTPEDNPSRRCAWRTAAASSGESTRAGK